MRFQYLECMSKSHPLVKLLYFIGNYSGKTMLDLGCGASIIPVISASKWYDEIYLSDYAETNRLEIQKWINHEPDTFNWQPYIELYGQLER